MLRLRLPPWNALLPALAWAGLLAVLPWWLGMPLLLALIATLLLLQNALTVEHDQLMRRALRWGLPGALIAMQRALGGDVLAWCMALLGALTGYTLLAALDAWLDRKPSPGAADAAATPAAAAWPELARAPIGPPVEIIELQPPRWQPTAEPLIDPRAGDVLFGADGYRFADGTHIDGVSTHASFSPDGRWFVARNGEELGIVLWDRSLGTLHRLPGWQLCGWHHEEPWLSQRDDAQLMAWHAVPGHRAVQG